jgi:spore coat protein CotH
MRKGIACAIALLVIVACGHSSGDANVAPSDAYPETGQDLATAMGCPGVYNPDQMLEFHLTMSTSDWQTVQQDCLFTTYVPADMSCGDGPPIRVGVRHKRSGGTQKPGLKIDINRFAAGQVFFGLKKMDWENGVGSAVDGCGTDGSSTGAMMSEYLGWRLHVRSGEMSSRVAFVNVTVNGAPLGAFLSVEAVDKTFVKSRLGDASGWIWKFSGSPGDGQQTNDGVDDPYDDYFCFFEKNGCAIPPADQLATDLPVKLDIPQLLTVGAVNAIIANHDAIMLKLNNYIYYDYAGGPREYFAWDLDTTMSDSYDVFTGTVPGGTTVFTDALFTSWEDDYDAIVTALLAGPLSLATIDEEIARVVTVAGPSLEADRGALAS